jgi:hypothetical protein
MVFRRVGWDVNTGASEAPDGRCKGHPSPCHHLPEQQSKVSVNSKLNLALQGIIIVYYQAGGQSVIYCTMINMFHNLHGHLVHARPPVVWMKLVEKPGNNKCKINSEVHSTWKMFINKLVLPRLLRISPLPYPTQCHAISEGGSHLLKNSLSLITII